MLTNGTPRPQRLAAPPLRSAGDKLAIVGPNGAGKSTLLKIIAGSEGHNSGVVTRNKGARVGYLPQVIIREHAQHAPQAPRGGAPRRPRRARRRGRARSAGPWRPRALLRRGSAKPSRPSHF